MGSHRLEVIVEPPTKTLPGSVVVRGGVNGSRGGLYLDFEAEIAEAGDEAASGSPRGILETTAALLMSLVYRSPGNSADRELTGPRRSRTECVLHR